ncbi:MAG: hypothetical protein IT364_03510, partial [Candidatus Hydrogenedentes bacterium]|nr:hypothetical protein [Candidatus Hydrogenedentota bacterium]
YVKKAIPLLEAQLKKNPKDIDRIEVLFSLGEYYRRTGETAKSKECFALLKMVQYTDEDGKKKAGHPYFVGLVEEVEKLPPEPPPDMQKEADDKQPQTSGG